uniref:Uncharacterized protein n=1 Tax=Avena sativa TaxID=4498 RepID=A0ACD5Z8Z3_AVESA
MLGQPSVIARLMGLEDAIVPAMPTPAIVPAAATILAEEDAIMVNLLNPSSSSQSRQPKCSPLSGHGRINVEYYRYCLSKMKPRLKPRRSSSSSSRGRRRRDHDRHHPQEELLEKIKEEFRASWQQASMAPPPAAPEEEENAAGVPSASGRRSSGAGADRAGWVDGRYIQRVAQENLRREKNMARYGRGANGKTKVGDDGEEDVEAVVVSVNNSEETEQQQQQQQQDGSEDAESVAVSSEEFFRDSCAAVSGEHEHDRRRSSASENSRGTPTRIAILRPTIISRATGNHLEPAFGTPLPSWKAGRDGGMEEFLRAVKERLDNEVKAKTGYGDVAPTTTTTTRKGWGSADTKGDTARQIREAMVSKEDLGRRLSRLESFRVFRGDRGRRDAIAVKSPEHMMLKRVRARIEAMSPKKTRLSGCSSPVSSRGGRVWTSPPADASLSGIGSEDERQSCCTGDQRRLMTKLWKVHGTAHVADTHDAMSPTPSPRALLRSLSAPASSSISTGGQETASLSRSRSFGVLRGTVASGLRQSIGLGGKLLMAMMHLSKKKPPSSSSSSPQNISAGMAPPSPVSPLEVQGRGGRHFSGGLSCTFLPESSPKWSPKCSSEFGASVAGSESPWRWKTDPLAESTDDPDRVYVRELLVAAGLFDDDTDAGTAEDTAIMRGDVFDEVEDAYYYRRLCRRVDGDGAREEEEDGWADRRRVLFDLANEALQALQAGSSSSSPSMRRWVIESGNCVSSSRLQLQGSELEDGVWRQVARAMTGDDGPAPTTTVDGMVEREVRRAPWMALREDVCAVGRKVERAIFDELVSEVVRQVFVRA